MHMSHFTYACKTEGEKRNLPLNFNTCRKVWWCFFSYFNTVFNMVFNTPNINIFNTPWNFDIAFYMHYSFQHMLKFSTCCFNIVFYTYYSFQHALKYSTYFWTCITVFNMRWNFKHTTCVTVFRTFWNFQHAFFTVFRTFWNFQHAFLQFSEHTEIFNMLFHSFQNMLKISTCFFIVLNSFSICFQHALQISTCSEIFNTLSNMKIWNI